MHKASRARTKHEHRVLCTVRSWNSKITICNKIYFTYHIPVVLSVMATDRIPVALSEQLLILLSQKHPYLYRQDIFTSFRRDMR